MSPVDAVLGAEEGFVPVRQALCLRSDVFSLSCAFVIVCLKAGSRQLHIFFNLSVSVGLRAMVCVVETRSLGLELQVIVNGRVGPLNY